jgi:hypothetical protein
VCRAVRFHAHNVGDNTGVEADSQAGGNFLALRRVVEQHGGGPGALRCGSKVSRLGCHEVVVQVLRGGAKDSADAVLAESSCYVVVQFPVQGNNAFPKGTCQRQQLKAALLERVAGVVNENKYFCHVDVPS